MREGAGHVHDQGPGLGQQVSTHGCQSHVARGAIHQLEVEVIFQLLDAPRQSSLGQAEFVGGLVEGPQLRNGDKSLQAIEIDFHKRDGSNGLYCGPKRL